MQITRPLAVLTLALTLATGGIAIAETQSHDDHAADVLELVLNDGAKWQGDQNMLTGMDAIHAVITTNLDAVHAGTASPDDLPLNFHPAATGARLVFTPFGAG